MKRLKSQNETFSDSLFRGSAFSLQIGGFSFARRFAFRGSYFARFAFLRLSLWVCLNGIKTPAEFPLRVSAGVSVSCGSDVEVELHAFVAGEQLFSAPDVVFVDVDVSKVERYGLQRHFYLPRHQVEMVNV